MNVFEDYLRKIPTALALCISISVNVEAQSVTEKIFAVRETGDSVASCNFLARDNLNSQQVRKFFLARPGGQTLSFSVMNALTVTAATIDATMDTASTALQQDNGGTDVGCCMELRRQGAVANFAQPASMTGGVIQTAADLSAVNGINADVKIVSAINWCGQAGTYAGCRNGNSLIVTVGFAAATIAHEFGHMQGLCHLGTSCTPTCGQAGTCTGCVDASSNNIMYFSVCAVAQNVISSSECTSYRSGATP